MIEADEDYQLRVQTKQTIDVGGYDLLQLTPNMLILANDNGYYSIDLE